MLSPSSRLRSSTVALITKFEFTFVAEPSEITGRSLIVKEEESRFSAVSASLLAVN